MKTMEGLRLARVALWFVVFVLVVLVPGAGWGAEPTVQLKTQLERVLKVAQDPEVKKKGRVA